MTATATMFPAQKRGPGEDAIPLWDFQREALDAVYARRAEGVTRQLISIPTGGGKTVTAVYLIAEVGLPAVFLCHRDELVEQTKRKLREFDPGTTVAVCKAEQGREVHELAGRDVVIASAPTLAHERRLRTLIQAVGTGGLLVVDEAHHSAAASWTQTIESLAPSLLVGLTATPKRGDGQGLDALYQEIVYSVPMKRLVERGMLARPVGIAIGTDVDLDSVKIRAGEFALKELEMVVNTPERNALVVDAYERHAADRTRTIAFCVDVAHTRALTAAFVARGHAAAFVTGETPKDERQALYRAFSAGTLKVLVNCEVLTEGFDEQKADCALMCRPTQSQSLYVQMAGRVLRKAAGKASALILDFVDLTRRHDLQTIMTLAGSESRGIAPPKEGEVVDLFHEVGNVSARKARVLQASERLGDLLSDSPFVWHSAGERSFAPCGQSQWICVVPQGEGFVPVRVFAPKDGQPGYDVLFKRPVDADTAMQIAQNLIPSSKLTDRSAEWRTRPEPATEAQYKAAGWLRILIPDGTTKAQASEMLDRGFFDRAFKRSGANKLEAAS